MAKAKSSNPAKKTRTKKPKPAELASEEVSAEAGEFEASADAADADTDAEMDREIESEMDEQLEMELEANAEEESDDEADDEADEKASGNEAGEEAEDGYKPEPFPNYKGSDEASERKKVQIEFPYSQMIRGKVPKVFEVAETVAEEWVNDGNFENVPVGHPLAQITVAAGLRKAKEVEKKLEEKGVFAMAKMGLEYAKSQLNDKLKKK